MINIDSGNKIITLTRGDTETITFKTNIGSGVEPKYYELTEKDILYFGLMEPNQKFEDAILKKRINYETFKHYNNEYVLKFTSSDTEDLLPGTYYYQIKLFIESDPENYGNESIYTIVPKTKFFILD